MKRFVLTVACLCFAILQTLGQKTGLVSGKVFLEAEVFRGVHDQVEILIPGSLNQPGLVVVRVRTVISALQLNLTGNPLTPAPLEV